MATWPDLDGVRGRCVCGCEGGCITRTYYDDEMSDKTPNTLLEKFLPSIRGVQPGKREGKLVGPLT